MTSPRISGVASLRVVIQVNAEQAPKVPNVGADPFRRWGRPTSLGQRETVGIGRPTSDPTQRSHRGIGDGMSAEEIRRNTGSPRRCG